MFEPEVFRKQMCCVEGSTCDIVGLFGALRSDLAPPAVIQSPGIFPPCHTLFTPLVQPLSLKNLGSENWKRCLQSRF